ncbi:MAG: hypothetical protein RLO49_12390, partial [Rhodospirillales bacterium]
MTGPASFMITRRAAIAGGAGLMLAASAPISLAPEMRADPSSSIKGPETMTYITANDGTQIFYRDWGPRDA